MDMEGNIYDLMGNFIGTTDKMPLIIKVNSVQAGKIDTTTNSVYLGMSSGYQSSGSDNSGFGNRTLYNTSGFNNTAIGSTSLEQKCSGNNTHTHQMHAKISL